MLLVPGAAPPLSATKRNGPESIETFVLILYGCTLRDGKFSIATMEAQMSRDFYIESIAYANIFLSIEIAARRNLRQVQTSRNSTT